MKPNALQILAKYRNLTPTQSNTRINGHFNMDYQKQITKIEQLEIDIIYQIIKETQSFWSQIGSWYTHHVSRRIDNYLGRSKVRYPKLSDLLRKESMSIGEENTRLNSLITTMNQNMKDLNKSQLTVAKNLREAYKTSTVKGNACGKMETEIETLNDVLNNQHKYNNNIVMDAYETKCKLTYIVLTDTDEYLRAENQKGLCVKQINLLGKLQVAQFVVNLGVKQRYDLYVEIKRSADNLIKVLDVLPKVYESVRSLENKKSRIDLMLTKYRTIMDAREELETHSVASQVGYDKTNKLKKAIVIDKS